MRRKVALITGASRGIGQAVAIALVRRGYDLALVARSQDGLEETGRMVSGGEERVLLLRADIGDAAEVAKVVESVVKEFGRLDALINVAGGVSMAAIADTTDEQWRAMLDVNLSATFYFMRQAWKHLKDSGDGVIVNISSMAARDPFDGLGAYAAGKAGVNMLGRVAAKEGQADGIRVHTIAPGAVETNMLRGIASTEQCPAAVCLSPEEVAKVIEDCVAGGSRHSSGEVLYLRKMI